MWNGKKGVMNKTACPFCVSSLNSCKEISLETMSSQNCYKECIVLFLNLHNLSYPTQTPFCHNTNLALCLITVDDNMKGKQVQIRIYTSNDTVILLVLFSDMLLYTANISTVLSTAFGSVICATVIWLYILQP